MTLLPIIYTSLMIFTVLFIFVLIISYASYKLKGGKNQSHYSVHSTTQPAFTNSIDYRNAIQPQISVHRTKSLPIHDQTLNKQTVVLIPKPKQISRNISVNRHSYETPRMFENNERIKVMNTYEKFSLPVSNTERSLKNQISSQSLTDNIFLNFYSDKNNSGFVSLTAN